MKITPTASLVFLIAANLAPLLGVLLVGWDVGTLLLLYWLESVIIGMLNIPKILICGARLGDASNIDGPSGWGAGVFTSAFFVVHFGMFAFVHLVFLQQFFSDMPRLQDLNLGHALSLSALGLFASHSFSFFVNFIGKREFVGRAPNTQMFTPYPRVMVMHVTVIFGGAALAFFGAPIGALIVLILIKIFVDIGAHQREHGKADATVQTP